MAEPSRGKPDAAKIDAWLAGGLTDAEAAEVEAQMGEFSESDPEDISPELLRELKSVRGAQKNLTPLVDLVKSRGATGIGAPTSNAWREVLIPSGDPELLGTLGGYEVLDVIATGGMGILLKGRDPGLNRIAALKVLSPELATNATARERFLREARAAAKLEHENILPIYGVYEEAVPWFAMRYVGGGSLQDVLDREEGVTFEQLKAIASQTAAALEAAHAAGIVHRDIKPANLLLDEDGEKIWVCDFGIARSTEDPALTYAGNVAGTPQYMSPEQSEGVEVDGRSDLFSLGAVLYRCAANEHAFVGSTTAAVLRNVVETTPKNVTQINARLPNWFERLIQNLLAKDPNDRFAVAGDVIRAVEEEHAPRPKFRVRRRRRMLASAAVLVLGLLVLQIPPVRDGVSRAMAAAMGNRFRIDGNLSSYESLHAAVAAASDGDRLLLPVGEPVAVDNLKIPARKSLSFVSAEPGARPVLTTEIVGAPGIQSRSALHLSGLDFRLNPERDSDGILQIDSEKVVLDDCHFIARREVRHAYNDVKSRTIELRGAAALEILGCDFDLDEANAFTLMQGAGKATMRLVDTRVKSFFTVNIAGPMEVEKAFEIEAERSQFYGRSFLKMSASTVPLLQCRVRQCEFVTGQALCWVSSSDPVPVLRNLTWLEEEGTHPEGKQFVQVSQSSSQLKGAQLLPIEMFGKEKTDPIAGAASVVIAETGEVFSDLAGAIEAASDGATLLLEGEFRLEEQQDVHLGNLTLRSAKPGAAKVVALHPVEHGLTLFGSCHVSDITFIRTEASKEPLPILGVVAGGGDVLIEDCRFICRPIDPNDHPGSALGVTDFNRAVVRRCRIEAAGGNGIYVGSVRHAARQMQLLVEDSVVIAHNAFYRVNRSRSTHSLTGQRCVFFCEHLYEEHPHARLSGIDIVLGECVIDADDALIAMGDKNLKTVADNLSWAGRKNVYRMRQVLVNRRMNRTREEFDGARILSFDEFYGRIQSATDDGSDEREIFDRAKLPSPITVESLQEALGDDEKIPAAEVLRSFK